MQIVLNKSQLKALSNHIGSPKQQDHLKGIYLKSWGDKEIIAVATNGHSALCLRLQKPDTDFTPFEFFINHDTVKTLLKVKDTSAKDLLAYFFDIAFNSDGLAFLSTIETLGFSIKSNQKSEIGKLPNILKVFEKFNVNNSDTAAQPMAAKILTAHEQTASDLIGSEFAKIPLYFTGYESPAFAFYGYSAIGAYMPVKYPSDYQENRPATLPTWFTDDDSSEVNDAVN